MKRICLYILIILTFMVTGCGDKDTKVLKHGVALYKNSSIEITKGINTVDINIDSGNLQIYCWDKQEIKFEAKHIIRDYETNEELEKQLKKYKVVSEEQENTFLFTVNYKGDIKNNKDIYTDIKLTIPRRIKNIKVSQQLGSLIIEDKFEGNIAAQLDSVNSEIKALKGKLLFKCEKGNLRLNSGKLTNESYADIKSGSIYLKAECQEQSKYSFQTQLGNVELNFPVNSNILLKSFGTVKNNQFTGVWGNIEIETSTKMGEISVNGY
jgi:hypothetical protein